MFATKYFGESSVLARKSLFSKPAEIFKMIKANDVDTGIVYEVCLDMQETL